jgi:hypothetical protein
MRQILEKVLRGLRVLQSLSTDGEVPDGQIDDISQSMQVGDAGVVGLCTVSGQSTIYIGLCLSRDPAVADVKVTQKNGAEMSWTEDLFCVACGALIDETRHYA